jgi:signal transduction histidine kinase/AmiR/NasT family two-component response regulator
VQLAKQRLAGQAQELERQVKARTAELAETQVDLVEALDELNRSHELMAEMSAIANIGAWEIEVETGQRRWSMQTKRILGLPSNYDPGSVGAFAFLNPGSLEVYKSAHAAALHGVPFDIEVQGTLSGGREIWGRLIGRPVFENDRVVRVAGSFQDVTAEYRRRAELEKARAEADAANAAKSAFLANMSHEIRTPLNGVIGIAGALARTPLTAQQQDMVALVQSSGETLQRLLGDILDLSRMEAGRLELRLDAVDLRDAVDTAAEVMRAQAEEKGLRFKINYAENARGLFHADAVRLRQMISNLTSNAVKFTERGEINVDVGVEERDGVDTTVAIDIRDTGIGFDEVTAQRLFGRFEQADSGNARQFGGSGLGLSISRSLARLMGGDITAVSRPGEGSTFQLRLNLPRTMPLDAYDRHRAALEQAAVGVPMMEGESALRILVAEDHPVNQQVVRLILEPCGVALTFAANGREAVEAFRVAPFDAILMDMQMPEMDGLAATRAIRALEGERGLPRTPIAMLSANAMAEHVEQARAAGCDLHIAKPITPDSLIDGIDQLMAQAAEDEALTALTA